MQLVIPLSEVQQFLSNQYNIDIDLKNIEVNKIEATYIDSVVLIIKEVKDEVVLIHYEVDGLATIATKVAHFFLKQKLTNSPIEWDLKNEQVKIDLNKIKKLKGFLKFVCISEIHVVKDAIVLEMYVRAKK
ncbi:MAG: hypothetical protein WCX31_21365 [Salinivirgaceae bacterium]|jgi:hypothetical protein